MMFSKRGDVSSYFLITTILVIAGFAVLLYFLFQFDFIGQTTEDLCKLSVLTRATSPSSVQSYAPLKCTTNKICLSYGADCDEFAGEKDVAKITLPSNDEKAAKIKIAEISANAMYDCWKIMGEGKLDLFGSAAKEYSWDIAESTCVICSRIAIARDVPEKIASETNINEYMRTHKISENSDLTYLQAFTDRGVNAYASVKPSLFTKELETKGSTTISGKGSQIKLSEQTLPNRQLAIVFMQIKSVDVLTVLKNLGEAGATLGGLTFLTPGVSTIAKSIVFHPSGAGLVAVTAAGIAVGGYGAYNSIQGQLKAAGYCGEFTTNEKSKEGCSLVQGLNYNVGDINSLCASIQGNP